MSPTGPNRTNMNHLNNANNNNNNNSTNNNNNSAGKNMNNLNNTHLPPHLSQFRNSGNVVDGRFSQSRTSDSVTLGEITTKQLKRLGESVSNSFHVLNLTDLIKIQIYTVVFRNEGLIENDVTNNGKNHHLHSLVAMKDDDEDETENDNDMVVYSEQLREMKGNHIDVKYEMIFMVLLTLLVIIVIVFMDMMQILVQIP